MLTPDTRRYRVEMPAVGGPRYGEHHPVGRCGDEEIGNEGKRKWRSDHQLSLRNKKMGVATGFRKFEMNSKPFATSTVCTRGTYHGGH